MGHEKQVAMAMQAFFASQFATVDPSNYAGPNEYVPEPAKTGAKLEVVDNPFLDNKAPPGIVYKFARPLQSILDMFVIPDKKRPRLNY